MNTVQSNGTTMIGSFSTTTSSGFGSSRAATASSHTSSGSYIAGYFKGPGEAFDKKPAQTPAPVFLQMPMQTTTRFAKPLQVKVFVGRSETREYVASVEVALLTRLCTNFEECSEKSAGGSSVLVERADRPTVGWFLRWLSQEQANPIIPTDGDLDERLRVCLARLYVFQRLGVILPSGKPEDLLIDEIANIVKRMPRILSAHVKYVYEHFSGARNVDYGQVFAALIAEATLNGSLYGMKDKTLWKSPPFVLFEKNLRAHLLSEGLLVRIQRIQEFKPISTGLLGFLLRFSNQGDQLRASLAKGLVRLEQSHRVRDAKLHCGNTLFDTGFMADIDAARAAGATAYQISAKAEHSSTKLRRDKRSGKIITKNVEDNIPVATPLEHFNTVAQSQGSEPNHLSNKTANKIRRFHGEESRINQRQSYQQLRTNRGEPETDRNCGEREVAQTNISHDLPQEVPRPTGVETQVKPLAATPPLEAEKMVSPKEAFTAGPHDIPKVIGNASYDSQQPKPQIVIRLPPPPPIISLKKIKEVAKRGGDSAPLVVNCFIAADETHLTNTKEPQLSSLARREKQTNAKGETTIPRSTKATPFRPTIPLVFGSTG